MPGLLERPIRASGTGPKLAQVILSGLSTNILFHALAGEDVTRLTRVLEVGKKIAA